MQKVVLKPLNGASKPNSNANKDNRNEQSISTSTSLPICGQSAEAVTQWRPLKLVYNHDIRLAQLQDNDGDLVTITCTAELRMVESSVDNLFPEDPDTNKGDSIVMLRLHVVEVIPEQEPPLLEEDEERPLESDGTKLDESVSQSSLGDSMLDTVDSLFCSHLVIDSDAHIDLHEFGMELCSAAFEETVTSEDAQNLLDKASLKFQEVATLAFFNRGNIHMKQIPKDEMASFALMATQFHTAYDWEKLEKQRSNKLKDPSMNKNKKEELLKRKQVAKWSKKRLVEISAEEATEQAAAMRSQIHLFWVTCFLRDLKLKVNWACLVGRKNWMQPWNDSNSLEPLKLMF
ncbi:unnamed protein product [Fraxinus pennsylvanica]|uniref:PB1 domain-containing protein n=1 Tax=Fraxinus pennsylvanica TaxID=56036 RepID=A0AAD2AAK1_9LAMI|nr:unnamed protein product [Fraxinus pennsylvanica]